MNPGISIRFGNNSTHKKSPPEAQAGIFAQFSGDVILPATTNAIRLVEEVFAVAQRLLGILVDGDRDGLDVLVAVAFPRR